MFGLDYVSGPPIAAMQAHDPPVAFVCRYVGYFAGYNLNAIATPQGKVLTPGEARANSQAGIATVSNYEWYAARATESASSGAWDARTADTIHKACGGPADRPIYFSVDEDVAGSQTLDYFKGVESVLGLTRTGAYGSYRVLQYLLDAHAISWGWQTYAWSGGLWEPRAHIQQYANSQTLGGHSVDFNRSMTSDFGQWMIGGLSMTQGVPEGWHDDGQTLTDPNGHTLTGAVRTTVLASNWAPGNVVVGSLHLDQPGQSVLLEDGRWGNGDVILFESSAIAVAWHPDPAVTSGTQQTNYTFIIPTGNELLWARRELADAQQQIATLKAQPPTPAPIDLTALLAAINNIPDAIGQAAGQATAAAIVEAKKL